MKHLTVTECFGSIPIKQNGKAEGLTPAEADELSQYVSYAKLDADCIKITRSEVTFLNYVGFIQLNSCSIEVLPKVSGDDPVQFRRVLLRMLQRTGYLDIHESGYGQLATENMNLFEIIAYLYMGKLLKELNRGANHAYREQQDELLTVRGRIDMFSLVKQAYTKSTMVQCTYDEFHIDTPLNQILKAAVRRIMLLARHMEIRRRGNLALLQFDEVQDVYVLPDFDKVGYFNRQNARFQECYRLAKLLLTQTAPTSATGRTKSSSILFKMNDLFESYVAYLVKKVQAHVIVKDRSRKLLVREGTSKGVFQLEPDLLILEEEKPRLIIDTKWKRISSAYSRHGVQRDDFYQMYAYLTRYKEVDKVILLYPYQSEISKKSGECLESWHLEEDEGKKLQVYSINYEDEVRAKSNLLNIFFSIN